MSIVFTKPKGWKRARAKVGLTAPPSVGQEHWSMDFMSDRLSNGRPMRMISIVVQYTRTCPMLVADTSISGHKVAAALEKAF